MKIGIINPGAMGVSIAAAAMHGGHELYWVAEGRSKASQERAAEHGITDVGTLEALCNRCEVLLSVCPPHAASEVAQAVMAQGFNGTYVDANAIAPQRAIEIAGICERTGARFIDGSIIGGPAWKADETILYLAGQGAHEIATLFEAGPLRTKVIGDEIGQASALKMCYAAYSKGSTALLAAILAAAQALQVDGLLREQWDSDGSDLGEQAEQRTRRVTAKAWRYVGEMKEIAATFRAVELPGGFHQAAAQIYQHMAQFKDTEDLPELELILAALLEWHE